MSVHVIKHISAPTIGNPFKYHIKERPKSRISPLKSAELAYHRHKQQEATQPRLEAEILTKKQFTEKLRDISEEYRKIDDEVLSLIKEGKRGGSYVGVSHLLTKRAEVRHSLWVRLGKPLLK